MQLKQKKLIALGAISLFVVIATFVIYKPYGTEIDKEIAKEIASDMFFVYTSRTAIDENKFLGPAVQNERDGWEISYSLKSDRSRRLGIFVDKFGDADYSEAP
jgi:hypothetical protein